MWITGIIYCLLAVSTKVLAADHSDGASKVSLSSDAIGNYQFSYSVSGPDGEHFRQEKTEGPGRVVGTYGLSHIDGRHRVVDYIADHGGFRANVRSNEPGVASSEPAAVTVQKLAHDGQLDTAATSDDKMEFGKRLKTTQSRVTYSGHDIEDDPRILLRPDLIPRRPKPIPDTKTLQSRVPYSGHDIEDDPRVLLRPDLLPRRPKPIPDTYRPHPGVSRPLDPAIFTALNRPHTQTDYHPPIDPHSAVRPAFYPERPYYPTSTSRKPYIPPYGGFDDEPLLVNRPGHIRTNAYPPTAVPTASYPRNVPPYYRPHSQYPVLPPPRGIGNDPNLVLRAVQIPNGIQAVRVDPSSGRVLEKVLYPIWLNYNENSEFDPHVLLHDDDFKDDRSVLRDYDYGRRLALRGLRGPFEDTYPYGRNNRSHFDDGNSLSRPSARDLAFVNKQLGFVEGHRPRYPHGVNNLPFGHISNSEHPEFDDFDDDKGEFSAIKNDENKMNENDYLRYMQYRSDRIPKHLSLSESDSKPKESKVEPESSEIEKE